MAWGNPEYEGTALMICVCTYIKTYIKVYNYIEVWYLAVHILLNLKIVASRNLAHVAMNMLEQFKGNK